jgi:AP-3 complex subunit mu
MIKLSGMPDLTLSFVNPRLLDDISFHPCVRFKRWEVRREIVLLLNGAGICSFSVGFGEAIILIDVYLQSEKVLSFVPPDGNFRLVSYHIGSQRSVLLRYPLSITRLLCI